jgi:hypothetical protein
MKWEAFIFNQVITVGEPTEGPITSNRGIPVCRV